MRLEFQLSRLASFTHITIEDTCLPLTSAAVIRIPLFQMLCAAHTIDHRHTNTTMVNNTHNFAAARTLVTTWPHVLAPSRLTMVIIHQHNTFGTNGVSHKAS